MTLNELLTEIYTITNRPDLTAESTLAVRKATVKLHGIDFFPRDLVEVAINIPSPAAAVQIDINAILPRFRTCLYVRDAGETGVPSVNSKLFTQVSPRAIMDEYGLEKLDVWYQGGQVINVKSGTPIYNLLLGYYQSPLINPIGSYASWIAVEQPYAIIEEAAANIFKFLGNTEQAKYYAELSMQNVILLRQNYLSGGIG